MKRNRHETGALSVSEQPIEEIQSGDEGRGRASRATRGARASSLLALLAAMGTRKRY